MIYTRQDPESGLRFTTWQCPKCPWYRVRTEGDEWGRKLITHPGYGLTSNYNAYMSDISSHHCEQTLRARIRHGIPREGRINGHHPKARAVAARR